MAQREIAVFNRRERSFSAYKGLKFRQAVHTVRANRLALVHQVIVKPAIAIYLAALLPRAKRMLADTRASLTIVDTGFVKKKRNNKVLERGALL